MTANISDSIDNLPLDDTTQPMDKQELEMLNALFQAPVSGSNGGGFKLSDIKEPLLLSILFMVFASTLVDKPLENIGAKNIFILLGIKLLFFLVLYIILKKRL